MKKFNEADWDLFVEEMSELAQKIDIQEAAPAVAGDIRAAMDWIERMEVDTDCAHERVRELTTITAGTKRFCVACNTELT